MDTGTGKVSREELLRALEEAGRSVEDHDADEGIDAGEMSEAERLAAHADSPRMRADGEPVGSDKERRRVRPLNTAQLTFARGLITGKTMAQAYRDAYPNAQANESTIRANAYKLSRDPRVKALIDEAWGETIESMSEDQQAVRRYVLKSLLALSKQANQEGSRLRALELMARSAGMFREEEKGKDEKVSPEKLRAELAGHLKLINNIKPIKRDDVANG